MSLVTLETGFSSEYFLLLRTFPKSQYVIASHLNYQTIFANHQRNETTKNIVTYIIFQCKNVQCCIINLYIFSKRITTFEREIAGVVLMA